MKNIIDKCIGGNDYYIICIMKKGITFRKSFDKEKYTLKDVIKIRDILLNDITDIVFLE